MRVLLLFRGAPGCGKSTYIEQNGLQDYTLSADTIRMQCSSPVQTPDGHTAISQKNDKTVWFTLFNMLELRMQSGCFTVIDAINSKTAEMNRYKALAKQYRYRIYIIDMTDLPIEECKRRNQLRPYLKRVPDSTIDKMYARFESQSIPHGITILKPETALETIRYKKSDMNQYRKVYVIGDIHGCYTALDTLLQQIGGMQDDCLYIFSGDYLDRGPENVQVLQYLLSITDKSNVLFLEGNHEHHLYSWAHDQKSTSKDFELRTRHELNLADINKSQVRRFYYRLCQCAYFTYRSKDYFICHGGIADLDESNPLSIIGIPSRQLIHGVGQYQDLPAVMYSWNSWNSSNIIQIAGHRNIQDYPIDSGHNYLNLEGHVEFGGDLRAVCLDENGITPISVRNTVYRKPEEQNISNTSVPTVRDLIADLRCDRYVNEKSFGKISAFNFSQEAFRHDIWNDATTVARGLFIDTENNTIVARGYEKFFRINELARVYKNPDGSSPVSNLDYLKSRLQFPVTAYVKENGYLALVSYDSAHDDLFFATKGSVSGTFVEHFKQMFKDTVFKNEQSSQPGLYREIVAYVKENNCTLLFEVVDEEFDPHIIDYEETFGHNPQMLFLLDCVKNEIEFKKLPYKELSDFARSFGFRYKEQYSVQNGDEVRPVTFSSWQEFYDFYLAASAPDYKYLDEHIEGFVIEDSAGFMTKLKTEYYSRWKFLRSVSNNVRRYGSIRNTAALYDAEMSQFYGFLREKYKNDAAFRDYKNETVYNIISLRNEFLAQQHKKDGEPV